MARYLHTLKSLCEIALEHGSAEQPDLALMARELGCVVHRDAEALSTRLAPLRARRRGFERWLVAEYSRPAMSVLIMAWPPNHITPVHDHGGLWGLEVSLLGALEVQSYERDGQTGDLRQLGRDWLGPGDGTWFEGSETHAHRCRNLSQCDTALTLHVYGGDLAQYFAYEKATPETGWVAKLQRAAIAGCIR